MASHRLAVIDLELDPAGRLFWTENSQVSMVDGGPIRAFTAAAPAFMAFVDDRFYVSSLTEKSIFTGKPGEAVRLWIRDVSQPRFLASDGDLVYWTSDSAVNRADPRLAQPKVERLYHSEDSRRLVVGGGMVRWIARAHLVEGPSEGGAAHDVADVSCGANGLSATPTTVYWTTVDPGSRHETLFAREGAAPIHEVTHLPRERSEACPMTGAIALLDQTVFWATDAGVMAVGLSTNAMAMVAAVPEGVRAVAATSREVFWSTPSGKVERVVYP